MSLKEDFIARLIKARSALGWSQADLSKASGISATQLSRYESGLSEPRPQALGKLSAALNVQFDWLAHGRGPIEGSTPDRPAPPGMRFIEVDLSDEELKDLEKYAQARGLTVEMAARQLALSGLKDRAETIKHLPENASEAEKGAFEHLKQTLADLEKRLSGLEAKNNP